MKLNGWLGGVISFAGIALISFSQGDAIQLNSGDYYIISGDFRKSIFRFPNILLRKIRLLTIYHIYNFV